LSIKNKNKNTMDSLQSHHITDLYCLVDDLLPKQLPSGKGGRPAMLSDSEFLTILIWNTLTWRQKTIRDLHNSIRMYHRKDFPSIPKYRGFIDQCHRLIPVCLTLLRQLLCIDAPVRLMDATMLPVCRLKRADSHKVAKRIAAFGKNHQGWHYGFKLHTSCDLQGRLCAVVLTPANVHDAQAIPYIINQNTRLAVGDTLYGARVMREKIWKTYGTVILAPPHPTQKTKIMTGWQHLFLHLRSKIECMFDYLKEHLHIVTSFPRSVKGYIFHYIRILLGYQILKIADI
jgi:hypothetical protein